jgi:hypothetical protein
MKFFRNFPLIAAALLGFIGYTFYKTSNFVNKGVEAKQQAAQDTIAKLVSDNAALSTPAGLPDTLHDPSVAAVSTAPMEAINSAKTVVDEVTKLQNGTSDNLSETTIAVNESPKIEEKTPSKTARKPTTKKKNSAKPTEPRFHVVVGSYEKEVNAKAKAASFAKQAKTKATVVKQGGFFRVCANEFDTEKAAADYAQKLKQAGEESIVVKF